MCVWGGGLSIQTRRFCLWQQREFFPDPVTLPVIANLNTGEGGGAKGGFNRSPTGPLSKINSRPIIQLLGSVRVLVGELCFG